MGGRDDAMLGLCMWYLQQLFLLAMGASPYLHESPRTIRLINKISLLPRRIGVVAIIYLRDARKSPFNLAEMNTARAWIHTGHRTVQRTQRTRAPRFGVCEPPPTNSGVNVLADDVVGHNPREMFNLGEAVFRAASFLIGVCQCLTLRVGIPNVTTAALGVVQTVARRISLN